MTKKDLTAPAAAPEASSAEGTALLLESFKSSIFTSVWGTLAMLEGEDCTPEEKAHAYRTIVSTIIASAQSVARNKLGGELMVELRAIAE